MTTTAARRLALGRHGESVAARHLEEAGLQVLARNWRCHAGEVDVVAREGAVLVVCEVKTRSTPVGGTPHEAVDDAKLARLQHLGALWAEAHAPGCREVRVDLVAVQVPRRGRAVVDHVRGIG